MAESHSQSGHGPPVPCYPPPQPSHHPNSTEHKPPPNVLRTKPKRSRHSQKRSAKNHGHDRDHHNHNHSGSNSRRHERSQTLHLHPHPFSNNNTSQKPTPTATTTNTHGHTHSVYRHSRSRDRRQHVSSVSMTSLPSHHTHTHSHGHGHHHSHNHNQHPALPPCDPSWSPVALINNRYAMGPKIGSGSFGSVHAGVDLLDDNRFIAIKLEPQSPSHHPQLEREHKIYTDILHKHNLVRRTHSRSKCSNSNVSPSNSSSTHSHSHSSGFGSFASCDSSCNDIAGIPKVLYFGPVEQYPFNAMVMEMMGPSLERLFNLCDRRFTLKTVLLLADQMLARLQFIHDSGYLHRDLKPDNFLMGIYGTERVVFAVDLGLAKAYIDRRTGRHIDIANGKSLTGTARYASINTHLGQEQSRKDDLESLGYIFMYFLKGRLPWQGMKAKTREKKYEMIQKKKLSTTPEKLCKGYPGVFTDFIRYSWSLGYDERPDYELWQRSFRNVFFEEGYVADWQFDWDIKGMNVTQLALDNHPWVRGNVPSDRRISSRRRRHHRVTGNGPNDDCKSEERCHWGGDKHVRLHYTKRKDRERERERKGRDGRVRNNNNHRIDPDDPFTHTVNDTMSPHGNNAMDNGNVNGFPIDRQPRHSLPILSRSPSDTPNHNDVMIPNSTLQKARIPLRAERYSPNSIKRDRLLSTSCFPGFGVQQTPEPPVNRMMSPELPVPSDQNESPRKRRSNGFFSCFNPPESSKPTQAVNTEKREGVNVVNVQYQPHQRLSYRRQSELIPHHPSTTGNGGGVRHQRASSNVLSAIQSTRSIAAMNQHHQSTHHGPPLPPPDHCGHGGISALNDLNDSCSAQKMQFSANIAEFNPHQIPHHHHLQTHSNHHSFIPHSNQYSVNEPSYNHNPNTNATASGAVTPSRSFSFLSSSPSPIGGHSHFPQHHRRYSDFHAASKPIISPSTHNQRCFVPSPISGHNRYESLHHPQGPPPPQQRVPLQRSQSTKIGRRTVILNSRSRLHRDHHHHRDSVAASSSQNHPPLDPQKDRRKSNAQIYAEWQQQCGLSNQHQPEQPTHTVTVSSNFYQTLHGPEMTDRHNHSHNHHPPPPPPHHGHQSLPLQRQPSVSNNVQSPYIEQFDSHYIPPLPQPTTTLHQHSQHSQHPQVAMHQSHHHHHHNHPPPPPPPLPQQYDPEQPSPLRNDASYSWKRSMARVEHSKSPYTPNTMQTVTNTLNTASLHHPGARDATPVELENDNPVHPQVTVHGVGVGVGVGIDSNERMNRNATDHHDDENQENNNTVNTMNTMNNTVSMEKQHTMTTTQPLKITRNSSAISPSPPPRSQKSHRSSHKNSVSKYSASKSSKSSAVKQNSPRLAEPINLKSPNKTTPSRALNVPCRPHQHQHHMVPLPLPVPVRQSPSNPEFEEQHFRDLMTAQHGMSRLSVTAQTQTQHSQHREESERSGQYRASPSHDSSEDKEEVVHRFNMRFMAPPLQTGPGTGCNLNLKEDRKNSGSTSKGLYRGTPRTNYTEEHREFSAHTETLNANRGNLETPTMSYTARRDHSSQHPFVGNASSASKGSISATQQTVSSEPLLLHKDSKMSQITTNIPITEEDEV